ncbi:hypothetical protein MFLAVUS_004306 [Mucor flavus]|uniref:Peptidase A1 domain-containing protein n=1 Tax=Mucor flavus TaxID=439312 RepID=A0ABP9YVJ1_9FUNG
MKSLLIIASSLMFCLSSISAAENKKIIKIPIKRASSAIIHNRFNKRATNNAALINASGKEYLLEVGVGTPPQIFNLTMDTGSADFWVPSTACPTTMCPHTRFNSDKSSSFKPLTEQLNIEYGIGAAKGIYGVDAVTVGSASLPNQVIGLVSNTNNILSDTDVHNSNGIIGLGFPGLSMKSGEKPGHFVMGLYESKVISEPIFSVFLNSQFVYGKSGEIALGGTDTTKHNTKDLQYAPVVSYDVSTYYVAANLGANATKTGSLLYWAVPGQGFSTSTGYKTPKSSLQSYILDTGTTLTYVPAAIAKSIVMSVTANAKTTTFDAINGVYRVSCSLYKKTNITVSFMISTSASTASTTPITVTIPVSELVIPLDDELTPETSQSCMFGIAPSPDGLELSTTETWIIGEATLRSIYSVYDLKENRVGFAKLSNGSANTNSTGDNASNVNPSGDSAGKDDKLQEDSSSGQDSSSSTLTPSTFMAAVLSIIMLYYL